MREAAGIFVIMHAACVSTRGRVRSSDGTELCLETCDCSRVAEMGTIIVAEWGEALGLLNMPFTVYNHVEPGDRKSVV